MGFRFELEHSNIVAYLTSSHDSTMRLDWQTLQSFAGSIAHEDSFISQDRAWLDRVREIGRCLLNEVNSQPQGPIFLPDRVYDRYLGELRGELSQYSLFCLVVGSKPSERWNELEALAKNLAFESGRDALVLLPRYPADLTSLRVLDPFPAFSEALEKAHLWPGLLVWTQSGERAFLQIESARSFVRQLPDVLTGPSSLRELVAKFANSENRLRKLLHLSDLHFGNEEAMRNRRLLTNQLKSISNEIDRVVITGDLFDEPNEKSANSYLDFHQELTEISGDKSPITIPGNHDMRKRGNFGSYYEQLAGLGQQPVVVDEELALSFACFNSCEGGSSARGRISETQFVRIGTKLTELRTRYPHHLQVSLLHHHPYSFEAEARTWYQRALKTVGLGDERFLLLENASEFLDWCARWQTTVVLHGHKHVARSESRTIRPEGATPFQVTAIGCGSSLGAEGSPLSYVVLSWDERTRRWVSTFYESVRGGPFLPKEILTARIPDAGIAFA